MKTDKLYSRSIALSGFDDFVQEKNGNLISICLKAGVSPDCLNKSQGLIDWHKLCFLLEVASKEMKAPQLGLQWALNLPHDFRNSGPVLFMLHMVPDIRNFLDMSFQYNKLHTNGVTYESVDDVESGVLRIRLNLHPTSAHYRQYIEHLVASIAKMVKQGQHLYRPQGVSFQHNPPEDMFWYDKAFECPVLFNQAYTEISIDRGILDVKTEDLMVNLKPALKIYLNELMHKNSNRELTTETLTSETITSIFGIKNSSMKAVAEILDLSSKKLQRLLRDEGTSYSEILDKTRQKISQILLSESNISIQRLAELLDYRSPEAFNAACKRWSGFSPRQYRNKLRKSGKV